MIWVTVEDVIALHSRVIEKSGGIDGLRDRALLEAAVAAPLQSFGGADFYPSVPEKVARLGYGLASNHAFLDGNKRIGALMVQLILKWNGYDLQLQTGELADAFIALASGTMNEEQLHNWICEHLKTDESSKTQSKRLVSGFCCIKHRTLPDHPAANRPIFGDRRFPRTHSRSR